MSSLDKSTEAARDPLDPEVARPGPLIWWRYDIREDAAGGNTGWQHFYLYGTKGEVERCVGWFAMEELARDLLDQLEVFDSMQGVGFDVVAELVVLGPQGQEAVCPWTLKRYGDSGQRWALDYKEIEVACLWDSGSGSIGDQSVDLIRGLRACRIGTAPYGSPSQRLPSSVINRLPLSRSFSSSPPSMSFITRLIGNRPRSSLASSNSQRFSPTAGDTSTLTFR